MKFKKKTASRQTIQLSTSSISITNGRLKILPGTFKKKCYLKTKVNLKDLTIKNNVDIVKEKGEYWIHVPVETTVSERTKTEFVAGVDLGVRTFATVHSNSEDETVVKEYIHRTDVMKRLNKKLDMLKKKRVRKKQFNKIEKKKKDLVDKLHWDFINDLLKNNDVVYLGDIKSHDIVKGGKNHRLNRDMNDLKFYQLKQRMLYNASVYQKLVYLIPEPYTTKCCSTCGTLNHHVGSKEVFTCESCHLITGRDMNASKNIKMKGLFS
jgi:IS605 OrfB family transposase